MERRLDHSPVASRWSSSPSRMKLLAFDEDEEARAARFEEENLTLRERLFLMERGVDDLSRPLLTVKELCRHRHHDGCVVDAGAGDEAGPLESMAVVASPGASDEAGTALAMEI